MLDYDSPRVLVLDYRWNVGFQFYTAHDEVTASMLKKEILLKSIVQELVALEQYIESMGLLGLYDSHIIAEDFIAGLLNLVFGYRLENLNYIHQNQPGIDLGDRSKGVAFQVTAEKTGRKIQETIDTFVDKQLYVQYSELYFLILVRKQSSYSAVTTGGHFSFDPERHVLDFGDLKKAIRTCPVDKLGQIYDFLQQEIAEPDQATHAKDSSVDIISRLAHYNLNNTHDSQFGVNELTKNLSRVSMVGRNIESIPATYSTIFLAIPSAPIGPASSVIFQKAYQLLDADSRLRAGERLRWPYASRVFPLAQMKVRVEQNAIVAEDLLVRTRWESSEEHLAMLRVNEMVEVSFATSYYTVRELTNDQFVFNLGGMIHLFWSLLCLVRELQESIAYTGNTHLCIAMKNTANTFLGGFAEKWLDPLNARSRTETFDMPHLRPTCNSPNLLISRENVSLSDFDPQAVPSIVHDIAEEVARAYKQERAKCFDQNAALPDDLWPVQR